MKKNEAMEMKRICVFCGSSPGSEPEYLQAARDLSRALAGRGLELVYGGAHVGVMGALATTMLEHGGKVIGVIPQELVDMEVAFTKLPDLRIVDSMHERKALMSELADGFIALPGGLGTLEEFFEVLTWSQLGFHRKPCGLLDIRGFYSDLSAFLDHMVDQKFLEQEHRSMILREETPEALLGRFEAYQPPRGNKARWILQMTKDSTAQMR